MYKQAIKFTLVGIFGGIINLSIYYLLIDYIGMYYILGAIIAYLIAISHNFLVNKFWTFRDESKNYLKQYGRYVLISISGLVINILVLSILVEVFDLGYLFSQIGGILMAGINSFILNKRLTFQKLIKVYK